MTEASAAANLQALLDIELPEGLRSILVSPPPDADALCLYRLGGHPESSNSVYYALAALRAGLHPPPRELVPLLPVDDRSVACVVCRRRGRKRSDLDGYVLRWHLDSVAERAQGQVLDVDAANFVEAMRKTIAARPVGLAAIQQLMENLEVKRGVAPKKVRAHEDRPLRLAVQNVIVGLAVFRHNERFDGLDVRAWLTCQAPHLAAHEGERGLLAMALCEAFRAGGTMEIRFDRHPEQSVPASLQMYARAQGLSAGSEDRNSLLPAESRALMWAVARLPSALRARLTKLCEMGALSPERACYAILSGTWGPVGLHYLLEASMRIGLIILEGGSDRLNWAERASEMGLARRALLTQYATERLKAPAEYRQDTKVIYVEDTLAVVDWQVDGPQELVHWSGSARTVPWLDQPVDLHRAVVAPRDVITVVDVDQLDAGRDRGMPLVVLVPSDAVCPSILPPNTHIARAPWTLDDLTRDADRRFAAMRVARA